LFVPINPLVWFAAINPRVEAIEQLKKGNKREECDAFDNMTPHS